MSHTLDRISTITLDHVRARIVAASERAAIACMDIDRRYTRQGPVPVAPSDMSPLPRPERPSYPTELLDVIIPYVSTEGYEQARLIREGCESEALRTSASPDQLVQAIIAVDLYADACEVQARQYAEDTRTAIEEYVATQIDAVKALVAMIAS